MSETSHNILQDQLTTLGENFTSMKVQVTLELGKLSEAVSRMDKRLFGNGQKGDIQHLYDLIDGTKAQLTRDLETRDERLGHRVSKLEQWMWRAAGGLTILGFVLHAIFSRH